MPLKANQHQNFSYEVLPLLFHNETSRFFAYIRKDGNQFLKFWWDRAGVNLEEEMRNSSEGLDFEIRTISDGRDVVFVRLPAPKAAPEAYFLALVDRPKKHSLLSWRNLGRVFALSRGKMEGGVQQTTLAELTKSARYVAVSAGPKPTMKEFYKVVSAILDRKQRLPWL